MIETLLKTIANHLKIFKTVLFLQNMEKFKNNLENTGSNCNGR